MYIVPKNHKCPKCGFECQYSPHDSFDAPVLSDGPTCPKCWETFVRTVAPAMDNTVFPRKKPTT